MSRVRDTYVPRGSAVVYRHRITAQIIGNTAVTAAAAASVAAGSGGASASPPGGPATEGLGAAPGGPGTGSGTATGTKEQRLSRMLDKIYETIELIPYDECQTTRQPASAMDVITGGGR